MDSELYEEIVQAQNETARDVAFEKATATFVKASARENADALTLADRTTCLLIWAMLIDRSTSWKCRQSVVEVTCDG